MPQGIPAPDSGRPGPYCELLAVEGITAVAEIIVQVKNLKKYFPVTKGLLILKVVGYIKAVDGISFSIAEKETFGLVGESGCGKTTTSKLILQLEKITSGDILFRGKN